MIAVRAVTPMETSVDSIGSFAKSVLNNHFEHGSGKVFNAVFHSNITNLIRNDSSLDVSTTMLLLQRIAYYIHTKREYPLSQRAFIDIINNS